MADSFPAIVQPMLPTLVRLPFSNPDFLFEPKWDGFRAICFLENGSIRFVSKNRNSLTRRFPDLQRIPKSINAGTAILDGEIVALDKKGAPCFAGLRSGKAANECAIVFYAFDLLYLNGDDLTQKPVTERKRMLKRILPQSDKGRVRYSEHVIGDGESLFRELEKRKLEGMVAKRADSLYVGGRTRAWLKIKTKAGREEMLIRSETWGHPYRVSKNCVAVLLLWLTHRTNSNPDTVGVWEIEILEKLTFSAVSDMVCRTNHRFLLAKYAVLSTKR